MKINKTDSTWTTFFRLLSLKSGLRLILAAAIALSFAAAAFAQEMPVYRHDAQKKYIHKDIGNVYLGMPFRKFVQEFNLTRAVVGDMRFEWFELTIPLNTKKIESIRVRVHGISKQKLSRMVVSETISSDDSETEIERLLLDRIPKEGFVYAMYIKFKPKFKLKSYALKTFGKGGLVRKADDPYHFYDIQWTKETADGLKWMIRSFHEGDNRELQLLGRIDDTEWGTND
jgi:hypothetical protein